MMPTAMANGRDGGDGARDKQQLFREERPLLRKEQMNSSFRSGRDPRGRAKTQAPGSRVLSPHLLLNTEQEACVKKGSLKGSPDPGLPDCSLPMNF